MTSIVEGLGINQLSVLVVLVFQTPKAGDESTRKQQRNGGHVVVGWLSHNQHPAPPQTQTPPPIHGSPGGLHPLTLHSLAKLHTTPLTAHRSGALKVREEALVKSRRGQVASWGCWVWGGRGCGGGGGREDGGGVSGREGRGVCTRLGECVHQEWAQHLGQAEALLQWSRRCRSPPSHKHNKHNTPQPLGTPAIAAAK